MPSHDERGWQFMGVLMFVLRAIGAVLSLCADALALIFAWA